MLVRKSDRVLELGAGTGVISLAIDALYQPREIVALEIQAELIAMLRRNAELNGADSVRAIAADLRKIDDAKLPRETFDLVVANPPYRANKTGRVSPDDGRRIAEIRKLCDPRRLRHGGLALYTAWRKRRLRVCRRSIGGADLDAA